MASLAMEQAMSVMSVQLQRVDNVTIVHAGEDLDKVIRPLANILETRLKLGNRAEFATAFRQDTDIALSIKECLYEPLNPDQRMVVVISNKFTQKCSMNKAAFEHIKNKLCSQDPIQSEFALVSPDDVPRQWSSLRCINLGIFVNEMEGGNVAEAIYKQWFGPQAKLSSQTDQSLSITYVAEEYSPERVRIIHAMVHQDAREKHWGRLATAIEDVANLENTAQCRLHFKAGHSVAQTLLSDLESFLKCSSSKQVNSVIVWCSNMLYALDQDQTVKKTFIDIICQDSSQQKLFTHLLFGVDSTKVGWFSQQLWHFLSLHKHVAYVDASEVNMPDLDYKPFVRLFLSHWAGTIRLPKSPEESSDPSIMVNSIESSLENTEVTSRPSLESSPFPSSQNQFQAQQDNRGDRLVTNRASMNQQEAHLIHQKAAAFGITGTEQDRLVTVNDSWNPNLAAEVRTSGEAQPDGSSNPPGNWRWCDLPSASQTLPERDGGAPPSAGHQPVVGTNRMLSEVTGPVSLDMHSGVEGIVSGLSGQFRTMSGSQYSSSGQGQRQLASSRPMTRACQPASSSLAEDGVKSRLAPGGFNSHSIHNASVPLAAYQNPGSQGFPPSGTCTSLPTSISAPLLSEGVSGAGSYRSTNGEIETWPVRDFSHQGVHHQRSVQDRNPSRLSSCADRELHEEFQRVLEQNSQCRGEDGRNDLVEENNGSVSHDPRSLNSVSSTGVSSTNNGPSSVTSQSVSGTQSPRSKQLDELDEVHIRQLKMHLDPLKDSISDWRDLASHFKIDRTLINYWKGLKNPCSPTELLIDALKSREQRVTIGDFMEGLRAISRYDVDRYMRGAFQIES